MELAPNGFLIPCVSIVKRGVKHGAGQAQQQPDTHSCLQATAVPQKPPNLTELEWLKMERKRLKKEQKAALK